MISICLIFAFHDRANKFNFFKNGMNSNSVQYNIKSVFYHKKRNYNNHHEKGQFFEFTIKSYEPITALTSFHCSPITMPLWMIMANTLPLGSLYSVLCTFAMNLSISICLLLPMMDFNILWKSILNKGASFAPCRNENITIAPADLHFEVIWAWSQHPQRIRLGWNPLEFMSKRYFSVSLGIKGEDKAYFLELANTNW